MSDIRKEKGDILEILNVTNYYEDSGPQIFKKRTKKKVLNNVTLRIHTDEFFGLVGESGCGKSTLGNAVLGLLPFEGTIKVGGIRYSRSRRKEFTRRVQAVFQDPMSSLDPRKTIGFTMREPLRAHHIGTKEEQEQAVTRMLELVGLDASYASRYPGELSGGQRQRVCIGAALMLSPDLIIADEAVSALDVSVGAQILNLFREIDRKADFAMLFISHNLNVVYYLCDRIAVMYRGTIVEQGTADEIYYHSRHPYTKLLLSAIPDFGARIEDDGTKSLSEIEKQHEAVEVRREDVAGACCFYHRCPHASSRCLQAPPLIDISSDRQEEHLCACVLSQNEED